MNFDIYIYTMMRFIKRLEEEVDSLTKKNVLLASQNKRLVNLLKQTELLALARLRPMVDPVKEET
jgi:hypothetical protein